MPDDGPDRQAFLGPAFFRARTTATLGIVGLGGGGSHVAQQLAHIGFQDYVLYDPDRIEVTNLTRLVGATMSDVLEARLKVDIAKRVIASVTPHARIDTHPCAWEDDPTSLRRCDIIFSCVDSFKAKSQLEILGRHYLVPVIDIGMDVHAGIDGQPHRMGGQVVLSLPGSPCLRCYRVVTDDLLGAEAQRYGAVGGRPQVVWPNGVLASSAIGLAIDLLTAWSGSSRPSPMVVFDGNSGTLQADLRCKHVPEQCTHFPLARVGPPVMRPLVN